MATELASAYIALYTKMPGVKSDITNALGGSDVKSALSNSGKTMGQRLVDGFAPIAKVGLAAMGAVAAAGLGTALVKGFQRLDAIDTATAKLRGLGVDAKSVDTIMSNALASVKGTAFGLGDAATVAAQAVAAGVKPGKDLEGVLKTVANAAAAAGTDLGDMGSIFAKAMTQANGVQNDVISQLADRGIPIYQALADQLGVTAGQVFKLASDGKINFDVFAAAATAAAGTVASEMGGTWSGLVDNMMASLGRIGEGILQGLFPEMKNGVSGLTTVFTGFEAKAKDVGAAIGGFFTWIKENKDLVGILASSLGVLLGVVTAVYTGMKIWAAVQAVLNVALLANPIGVIIMAVAALAGAIIWIATQTTWFQDIWETVTKAIGTALTWLWESVISPLVDFIVTAWGQLMSFFNDAWTNVLQPVFAAIGAVFTWVYENVILPVVTAIMLYIGLWAALVQFVWENVIQPAMTAIGALFTWLWVNAVQPAVNFINLALQGFGIAVQWLNSNIIQPVFAAIGAIFGWIYNSIVVPIVNGVIAYFQMLGAIFTWLYSNVVQPVFNAVGAAFNWIWGSIIRPVINFINSAINNVGSTIRAVFGGIASFVGSAFQAVLGVVRGPINALINLINGIIGGLNSIKVNIPSWVPIVGGQTFGLNIPKIPRLAEGGLIPRSPGGTLAVVGEGRYDEVVMPLSPEVLRELRGDQQGGIRPGDRVVFEVEGQPLTAVAKRVVRSAFPTAQSVTSEFAR